MAQAPITPTYPLRSSSRSRACWAAVLATLALTACSSDDSKVYQGYKCGRVAEMLGNPKQAAAASLRVAPLLINKSGDGSQFMMKLQDKFSDDLELHKLKPAERQKKAQEVYDSDDCQRLFM